MQTLSKGLREVPFLARWALLLLLCVAMPAGAAADWDAFFRAGARWVPDEGLGLVSQSSILPQLEAGAAYGWTDPLALELAGSLSGSSAEIFGGLETGSLTLLGLRASARYALPLTGWLRSTLRAGFTLDWASLSLGEEGHGMVQQTRLVPGLQGLAGVEAVLRPNPMRQDEEGVRLVFSLEGGYLAALREANFDRMRPSDSERSDRLRAGSVAVGPLDLSGWLFQLGAGIRF